VTTRRPGGKARGARRRRRSPGGRGGRPSGGGWRGSRRKEYGDEEPLRPRQVGEEDGRVLGADGVEPAAWQGARASVGRWTADSGRPRGAGNPGGKRTGAPRKAAVEEDDGGGGGGGHDDDDGGGSGTKKWPSAGGGG
jgi:hypothetical protein